jgi:hypothetical protein
MGEKKRRDAIDKLNDVMRQRMTAPDHRLKPSACLGCGKVLDGATVTDGRDVKPHPGAVSICFSCGHIQMFADDMSFRPLTDDEIYEVAGHPELVMAGTVLKPWRELYDLRDSLTPDQVRERLLVIFKAVAKAERGRNRP